MTIKEMREALGDTQRRFGMRYGIPYRSIQNWESGKRLPPDYFLKMLEERVKRDLVNRRTIVLPHRDPHKENLPARWDFGHHYLWLKAIRDILGQDFVFALDTSLICQDYFLGRMGEAIIFGYGSDELTKYNGVVLLGNEIDSADVEHNNNLLYTTFYRTLLDSMDNEGILDPQGILEGLNYYYSTHGNSFKGLNIPPDYQDRFRPLAQDAIEYFAY